MTTRELINKLLDEPMDMEVLLYYEKEFIDERGEKCSGYCFKIDDVINGEIMFTDWRDGKAESNIEKRKPCIHYKDGCEGLYGCPCVYYKTESEGKV